MTDIELGTVLKNRYRIDAKLGEGGMAVVYRAYDQQRRVTVALKLLKPDYAEDTSFIERFHREAQNLRRLQHPHIVRFYEIEDDHGLVFMVLDYIDGPTLRKVVRQLGRPLTPGELLGYLDPICAALSYAHSERVVHCDMKPANIMIDRTGRVFVNDFGIARLSESATVTFSTPGTAAYMAPEQWRGGEDVYPATDVYALGVMLHELLTGRALYTGETAPARGPNREKIMWEHLNATPAPASRLNPSLPAGLDAVLARCLAKDPVQRYSSAEALFRAFEGVCAQAGISANPVPLPSGDGGSGSGGAATQAGRTNTAGGSGTQTGGASPLPNNRTGLMVAFGGVAVVALVLGALVFRPPPTVTPIPAPGASITLAETNTPVVITATPEPAAAAPVVTDTPETVSTTPTPSPSPTTPSGGGGGSAWHLAFTSDQSGADAVWVMDQNGGSRRQVTLPSFGLQDWFPEWCNSNRQLLFERGDHVAGTTNQTVYQTAADASPGSEGAWSGLPGKVSLSGSPACAAGGAMALFGAVADRADWRLFAFNGGSADVFGPGYEKLGSVALSNDGQWAAFVYRDPGDSQGRYRLFKAPLSSPSSAMSIQPAGVDSALAVSWSPDGSRLAYVCQAGDKTWQLCISDSNGGSLQLPGYQVRFTDHARGNVSALAGGPSWSPDGKMLAFASNGDGDWDIYVIGVGGGSARNVTDDLKSNEFMPAWSK